jgi:hypothetical protein
MNKEIQNEQELEEVTENKNGIVTWIKAHKKQLVLIGISIPTLIAIVLGLKNKDAIKELFDNLRDEIEKANLYSSKWFENATDAELDTARENVRLDYCSSGDDFKAACILQNLLERFDKERSKRAWGNETPHAPSIHREHGRYLLNDD